MLETMLHHLEVGYTSNANPYHNNLHACDVLQTTHYFISQTGLSVRYKVSPLHIILIMHLSYQINYVQTKFEGTILLYFSQ